MRDDGDSIEQLTRTVQIVLILIALFWAAGVIAIAMRSDCQPCELPAEQEAK